MTFSQKLPGLFPRNLVTIHIIYLPLWPRPGRLATVLWTWNLSLVCAVAVTGTSSCLQMLPELHVQCDTQQSKLSDWLIISFTRPLMLITGHTFLFPSLSLIFKIFLLLLLVISVTIASFCFPLQNIGIGVLNAYDRNKLNQERILLVVRWKFWRNSLKALVRRCSAKKWRLHREHSTSGCFCRREMITNVFTWTSKVNK